MQDLIPSHLKAGEWVLPPVPPDKPRGRERMRENKLNIRLGTRELSQVAVLSAIFVVASALPFSAFIGGAGFITLGIVFVPVVARILRPRAALISGLSGALAMYALQFAIAPVFGPITLVIPTSGIFLGSIAFHNRKGSLISWAYVLFGAGYYILFSGGTYLWLAPYLLVLVALPFILGRSKIRLPILCLYSTMCELVTMNIASIAILKLPGPIWITIAPFMFFERTLATIGSFLVITGLHKTVPGIIGEE